MSKRIRYIKSDVEGYIKSAKSYNNYSVHINVAKAYYSIQDIRNNKLVTMGKGGTLLTIKRKAKGALIKLGVVFAEEERDNVTNKKDKDDEYDVQAAAPSGFSAWEDEHGV